MFNVMKEWDLKDQIEEIVNYILLFKLINEQVCMLGILF